MNSEKVIIEIWSDVVCPFCYIGKKKLEKAIDHLNAKDQVTIVWHSFQLDPDFPENVSVNSTEYLSQRKGYPIDQIEGMCNQLTAQGKGYGIDFNFDNALTFNTFDAHRLIQWSKTFGKSNALKEAFMVAYFSNGVDLSSTANVLEIVEGVGLDCTVAEEILTSEAYAQEVEQDIYQAQQLGIRGVPFFLINEKEVISGAQSDHVFENVISTALKSSPQKTIVD